MGELVGGQAAREVKKRVKKYGQTDVWLGRYDSDGRTMVANLKRTTAELLGWFGIGDDWAKYFPTIQFSDHYEYKEPETMDLSGYGSAGEALFDLAMTGLPFEESDGGTGGCKMIGVDANGYNVQLLGEGQCWPEGDEEDPETDFSLTFSAQIMTEQAAMRLRQLNQTI